MTAGKRDSKYMPRVLKTRQKGDTGKMKIAVAYENGYVSRYSGETRQFKLYETEDGVIVNEYVRDIDANELMSFLSFLRKENIDAVICGGIIDLAVELLKIYEITLIPGVEGPADQAVKDYLAGTLQYDPDTRVSHPEESAEDIIEPDDVKEGIVGLEDDREDIIGSGNGREDIFGLGDDREDNDKEDIIEENLEEALLNFMGGAGGAKNAENISGFDRIFLDENLPRERYENYKKAADKGDAVALSELGNIEMVNGFYYHDEERRLRGIRCIREAAEKGEKNSATYLGFLFLHGEFGVQRDVRQAMIWFKKGADLGDNIGRQQYEKGLQYGFGVFLEDEEEESAETDLEKDGKACDAEDIADAEYSYLDGELTREKYELLRKAADSGNRKAMYEYGMAELIYGFKSNNEERMARGKKCLEESAKKGYAAAATFLGTVYHEGKYGQPMNMEVAVIWYKEGAKLGDPLGMSNYAVALQHGSGGLERDDAEAFKWIRAAANMGIGIAQYNAALALHAGRGVHIDRRLAKEYFRMAAKNGIGMAEMWLYSEDYKD